MGPEAERDPIGNDRARRHLDPTASYWSNDTVVTYQVYEPLYGYHYLKRPFRLVPRRPRRWSPTYLDRTATSCPRTRRPDQGGRGVYDVPIKPGSCSSPHPAFARTLGASTLPSMKPGELGDWRHADGFQRRPGRAS